MSIPSQNTHAPSRVYIVDNMNLAAALMAAGLAFERAELGGRYCDFRFLDPEGQGSQLASAYYQYDLKVDARKQNDARATLRNASQAAYDRGRR